MCRDLRVLSTEERGLLKTRDVYPVETPMDVVRRLMAKFRKDRNSAGTRAKFRTVVVSQGLG